MKKYQILDVNISAINLDVAQQTIDGWIKNRDRRYVCVAPVSTIMSCQDDPAYKEVINQADMVTPDGMPVVWLGRWQGNKEVSRTYGPDLMRLICDLGQDRGYRHYFYGGTEAALEKLVMALKQTYPKINIVGQYSPPFRPLNPEELKQVIDNINKSQADILWVGLGSPKQDFWIKENRDKLNVSVMVGVGAAFDFLSGAKKQAPRWMQKTGLEWLFRLACEPKRLWRRYIIGNPRFVYLLIKHCFKRK